MINYICDQTFQQVEDAIRVPNTGSYTWTVPNALSSVCQIRVWDPEDYYPWGNSSFFTIYSNEIAVKRPNGGEHWTTGTNQTIQWSAFNNYNGNVKIEYSTNNGAGWNTIAPDVANIGKYIWAVPSGIVSSNCLIRISDKISGTPNDISNAAFTIDNTPTFQAPGKLEAENMPVHDNGSAKDSGWELNGYGGWLG